ncbi:MAG: hypothetical protein HY558_01700 [Euryarchaeota archaeon]|nr:hypothetical protein [Euryarchaeota archaeon]
MPKADRGLIGLSIVLLVVYLLLVGMTPPVVRVAPGAPAASPVPPAAGVNATGNPLSELRDIMGSLWWLLLVVGIGVAFASRRFPEMVAVRRLRFRRDQVVLALDHAHGERQGFRKALGVGLVATGIVLFLLDVLILGLSPLTQLLMLIWLLLVAVPVILSGVALWGRARLPVRSSYTRTLSMKQEELPMLHQGLLYQAEELGFLPREEVTPYLGLVPVVQKRVFTLLGGARLVLAAPRPRLYLVLAVVGAGLLGVGPTLLVHAFLRIDMAPWMNPLGLALLFAGLGLVGHDAMRKQRGELVVVEEGSTSLAGTHITVTVAARGTAKCDEAKLKQAYEAMLHALDSWAPVK